MSTRLTHILLVTIVGLCPSVTMAKHVEGQETNVVVLACFIDSEAPYRIDVVSSSVNTTSNPIPNITRHHSCAQTLHELMTSGFEIIESSLENLTFVFVLTRQDESKGKH